MGGIVDAITGRGSKKAAKAQAQAAEMSMEESRRALQQSIEFQERALAQSQQQFQEAQERMDERFQTALELGEPYRESGQQALARYESLLFGVPINETAAFQAGGIEDMGNVTQAYDFEISPSYQFRLEEGQKALERSAAARSGLTSGSTLKAVQRYGQDMASLEYDNILRRIGSLADLGAQAAGMGAGQAIQTGNIQAGLSGQQAGIGADILGQSSNLAYGTGQALAAGQSQVGAARASGYLGRQRAGENIINMAAGFAGMGFGGKNAQAGPQFSPHFGSLGAPVSYYPSMNDNVYWR